MFIRIIGLTARQARWMKRLVAEPSLMLGDGIAQEMERLHSVDWEVKQGEGVCSGQPEIAETIGQIHTGIFLYHPHLQ